MNSPFGEGKMLEGDFGSVADIDRKAQNADDNKRAEAELIRRDKIMRSLLDDLQAGKERLVKQALELRQLATIVESSNDAIISWTLDGKIVSWNPAAQGIYGYSREEAIGQPIAMLVPSDHIDETPQIIERIRLGEPIEYFETKRARKDGRLIDVSLTLSPIRNTRGDIDRISAIARDITDRKAAEQQLQMLGHTIASMNECVVITDMQNTITFANPAFLRTYRYDEHEIIGKNIAVLRSRSNSGELNELIRTETRKRGWQGELINVRKSGEEFPTLLSTSVIYDREQAPIALVGISRDISEQKELQKQLDQIARQRTEDLKRFATSIQQAQEEERRRIARELHDDLGQQLSGLKFNIEVFEDIVPKKDRKTFAKLKHFKKQIDNMIIAIRRISSDLHPSVLDDFGLRIALQLLCKEFEKVHHVKVTFQSKDSQLARFDPHIEIALYRIAQEALANIAKHAAATNILLQLSLRDHDVVLALQDNGAGFDVQSAQLRKGMARGLGLISMKERAEHLGGTFRIESVSNRGTNIFVEIPFQP